MDASRFDSVARALASGAPRRDALRMLAGASVALTVARIITEDAVACEPHGEYCEPHTPCCSPHVCILHTCLDCIEKGQTFCGGHKDCCKGLKCDSGKCVKDKNVKCEGNGCKRKKRRKKKKH
ncbi:MAG: hypothetical protein KC442_02625 [Thermomicrobiales bacterium]|nr:hypothetical protein [Thermomicrobiales bacterium]